MLGLGYSIFVDDVDQKTGYIKIGDMYAFSLSKEKIEKEDLVVFIKAGARVPKKLRVNEEWIRPLDGYIYPKQDVENNILIQGVVFSLDILSNKIDIYPNMDLTIELELQNNTTDERMDINYKSKGLIKRERIKYLTKEQKEIYNDFINENIPISIINSIDMLDYNKAYPIISRKDFEVLEHIKGINAYYEYNLLEDTFKIYNDNFEIKEVDNPLPFIAPYIDIKNRKNIDIYLKEIARITKSNIVMMSGIIYGKGILDNYYELEDINFRILNIYLDDNPQTYKSLQLILDKLGNELQLVPFIETIKLSKNKKDLYNHLTKNSLINQNKKCLGVNYVVYEENLGFCVVDDLKVMPNIEEVIEF